MNDTLALSVVGFSSVGCVVADFVF